MNGTKSGEIILFPKTLDYYQIQLTKMLEKEAYGDAIRLLRFLLQCKTEDERTCGEWAALLDWLVSQFPDAAGLAEAEEREADEGGEEELLRASVNAKSSSDRMYIQRLLEAINHSSLDKQLLALDQLAYAEEPGLGDKLLDKLKSHVMHPFAAFKLLQTLSRLGVHGEASFGKLGEIVSVEIERTPLGYEQFPAPIPEVAERVSQCAEVTDPTLSYFAVQTWQEFLAYCYGNTVYRRLETMTEELVDVWAAALHTAVAETMYGDQIDAGETGGILDQYGITEMYLPSWEQACNTLRRFFCDSRRTNV